MPGDTQPVASMETERVFKVIRLVASSPLSWEAAAQVAIAEATKTITDLSIARVIETDAVLGGGQVVLYRVKLEASFQLDRLRNVAAGEPPVRVRRYLVVANQTLSSPGLSAAIRERHLIGPAEFHVVVPASTAGGLVTGFVGDPITGQAGLDAETIDTARIEASRAAHSRLQDHEQGLAQLGATYTAEVGPADPYKAILQVLARASFDEILISTLPERFSQWLHLDLPQRVRRATPVPVTVFTPNE